MNEWRGEKTGSAFLCEGSRRKSDVVPVTRYFRAITAFFLARGRLPITTGGKKNRISHDRTADNYYYPHNIGIK